MMYQRGKRLLGQYKVSWEWLEKKKRKFWQIGLVHMSASFVTYAKYNCKISY